MFYFGVDYYPEHWPEERWPEDARLMVEAGFNMVRLAEFAWSKMEPRDGHYNFGWLDRAISILASHDIRVVLGTPTASPPSWLMTKHPDIFRVREDGQRLTFGNRRTYCPNNPVYHDHTCRIVTQMAEHYAEHPAVIGWQIDNERSTRRSSAGRLTTSLATVAIVLSAFSPSRPGCAVAMESLIPSTKNGAQPSGVTPIQIGAKFLCRLQPAVRPTPGWPLISSAFRPTRT